MRQQQHAKTSNNSPLSLHRSITHFSGNRFYFIRKAIRLHGIYFHLCDGSGVYVDDGINLTIEYAYSVVVHVDASPVMHINYVSSLTNIYPNLN